jgi:hypothetical protein
MLRKGTTTTADLYEEVKTVLRSLDIPIQELVELEGWSAMHVRKEEWRLFAQYQRRESNGP